MECEVCGVLLEEEELTYDEDVEMYACIECVENPIDD